MLADLLNVNEQRWIKPNVPIDLRLFYYCYPSGWGNFVKYALKITEDAHSYTFSWACNDILCNDKLWYK